MTYSVWMKVPATAGWSRIVGGLSKEDAEWLADKMLFEVRAMPDKEED